MIANLLDQAGIASRIDGEYLQGGIGELQAMNFVRVLVAEEQYIEAQQIIKHWDDIQPVIDLNKSTQDSTYGLTYFVIGMLFGAAMMYWLLKQN